MRRALKNAYLRKILRFYLLTFLLPFIALSALIMQYALHEFSDQALKEQLNATAYTISHLEASHESFLSMITQLEFNDELRNADLSTYSGMHKLQSILHLLTAAHDGLDHIWYWLPDSAMLLSADDSLMISRLDGGRYRDESSGRGTISEQISRGEIVHAYDELSGRSCIFFPYQTTNTGVSGTKRSRVVFQIDAESFRREMRNLLDGKTGVVLLLDAKGEQLDAVVEGTVPEPWPEMQAFYEGGYGQRGGLLLSNTADIYTRVDGREWTLYCLKSSQLAGLLRIQQSLTILLATLLSLGFLVTIAVAYKLYKPIHSIRSSVERAEFEMDGANDYEYIESCAEHIIKNNQHLKTVLASNAEQTNEFILSMLLMGKIRDLSEFQSTYGFSTFSPTSEAYHIACVIAPPEALERVRHQLPADVLVKPNAYGVTLFVSANTPWTTPIQDCAMGVSGKGEAFWRAPSRCAEAMFASGFAKMGEICHFDELDMPMDPDAKRAFLASTEEKSMVALRKWREYSGGTRDETATILYLLLTHTRTLGVTAIDDASMFYLPDDAPEPQMAIDAALALLADLMQPEEAPSVDILERMLQYIAAQYDSPNFSIKQMAQDFSMSISSLSSFFKARTGTLLSEHIGRMKMNKAMQMLENTQLTVNEIGLAIGYYNVNSFIRRFNQMHKMTPGEYRTAAKSSATRATESRLL